MKQEDLLPSLRAVPRLSYDAHATDAEFQSVALYSGGVIVARIHGALIESPELVRITQSLHAMIAQSKRTKLFFDLRGFSRYESVVRRRYTDALTSQLERIESVIVHADSTLVRMGTSVASLAVPQLTLVDSSEFLVRLEKAISA